MSPDPKDLIRIMGDETLCWSERARQLREAGWPPVHTPQVAAWEHWSFRYEELRRLMDAHLRAMPSSDNRRV